MRAVTALPTRLYTAAQVRELDRRTIEDHGVPGYELMQRAGRFAYGALARRWPGRPLVVVCGAGNNAGDGYVVAAQALAAGVGAEVVAVIDPGRLRGDAATACRDFLAAGGKTRPWDGRLGAPAGAVLVDGLLGTGLDRTVEGEFANAVHAINDTGLPVMALDLPSGLHADTGRVMGVAVRASLTTTFVGMKTGLLMGQGPDHAGVILYDDLGAPEAVFEGLEPAARRLLAAELTRGLRPRPRDAHKGLFGHALVIGGGPGMPGAARLAGQAALRAGAGLVTVATVDAHVPAIVAGCPELMCRGVSRPRDLEPLLDRATVVAVGPGLGRGDWSRAVFDLAFDSALPLIVDADGLNLLAEMPRPRQDWLLTPHPGEAARLLGTDTASIQADRLAAFRSLSERYGAGVVLKGAGSLVGSPGRPPWLCGFGNPGMAVAGMGDILTGVVAGLAAQLGDLGAAARLGVLAHALAGDDAARAGARGLMASDLLEPLRRLVNP
jgi:NAD(P)H-hydrate epimerase